MTDTGAATPSYRLPGTSRPSRYDLSLSPDFASATFAGEERIEIEISTDTETLVLNAVELS